MEKNLKHIKFSRKPKNDECVICGTLKNFAFSSLCIECSPFMYKKQGYPHQKVRRTKKWKENRKQLLVQKKHQCEWCGSKKEPFSIHHSLEINSRTYEKIWNDILTETINSFLENNQQRKEWFNHFIIFERNLSLKKSIKNYREIAKKEQVETCPKCGNTSIIKRKTITPPFRCAICKTEFSTPKISPKNHIKKKLEKLIALNKETKDIDPTTNLNRIYMDKITITKFIGKILPMFYKGIRKKYEENVESMIKNYLNMEDTEVLCKRCHNAHRKGLELCPICKRNFHSPLYDSCYQCHSKEKKTEPLLIQKICDLLDTSKFRVLESQMEGDCIKCGNWTFEDPYQYAVYLPDKNSSVGFLCHDCFKEYKKTNENRYIVKIENE